jgi:glycerol-3-phosphate acyltransferase PlsY
MIKIIMLHRLEDCLVIFLAVWAAYLVGSISSAIIVCKMMGLPDPRTQGSRNPGATNVLRIGGKKAAVITLFADVLKGMVPILVAKWYGMEALGVALVAFAVFLGHLFPVFFRFAGGKGVATALGCVWAISGLAGLSWIATWLVVAVFFRYSSLSGLMAAVFTPFYIWYFTGCLIYVYVTLLMSIILIYRHRHNIVSLVKGRENKIGGRISF